MTSMMVPVTLPGIDLRAFTKIGVKQADVNKVDAMPLSAVGKFGKLVDEVMYPGDDLGLRHIYQAFYLEMSIYTETELRNYPAYRDFAVTTKVERDDILCLMSGSLYSWTKFAVWCSRQDDDRLKAIASGIGHFLSILNKSH